MTEGIAVNKLRTDRYGNEIVPRQKRLESGEKSAHKLTFMDKIQKQKDENEKILQMQQNGQEPAPGKEAKTIKKIVNLPSDPYRGLVNVHHV